ncbi:hypothetical protein LCGC14_3088250 [marine sediment metagenome]|uniref:Uncharacterized protein n=1 Tax=marine sediment metagenome TaxID=412755 RepID=A0A0F8WB77_9ZZZZ
MLGSNRINLFDLFMWCIKKNKYKCPRCNYPLFNHGEKIICENCGEIMFLKKRKIIKETKRPQRVGYF